MLTSKVFGSCTCDLRKAIADFIKYICINEIEFQNNATSLGIFLASGLVLFDKNPGLRPIGVGEVVCKIAGKVVMSIVKDDETKAVRNLQLRGGQDAGCEPNEHSMHDIFGTNKAETVLLADAENAFNSINRQVFLHNIRHICPPVATFVHKCYNVPARIFVLGGKELLSHEGNAQADPISMAIYRVALRPLRRANFYPEKDPKMIAFADDLTSAGNCRNCAIGGRSLWMLARSMDAFENQPRQLYLLNLDTSQKLQKYLIIPT